MNNIRAISEKNTRKIQDHTFYIYRLGFLTHRKISNSMNAKFSNLKYKIKKGNYKIAITVYSSEPDKYKRILGRIFNCTPVYHITRIQYTDRDMHRKTLYNRSGRTDHVRTLQELAHGD